MRTRILQSIVTAFLLSAVAACSSSETSTPAGSPGSCDETAKVGICWDYTGTQFTPTNVQSACPSLATYSPQPCPTANRIGSCSVYTGQPTEQTVRYFSPKFDEAHAKTTCAAQVGGVYTPG